MPCGKIYKLCLHDNGVIKIQEISLLLCLNSALFMQITGTGILWSSINHLIKMAEFLFPIHLEQVSCIPKIKLQRLRFKIF